MLGVPPEMSSAVRYRRYACACLQLAQLAPSDADRALLVQMAETWRNLAARCGRDVGDDEDSPEPA